jgi:universal stress protein A
MKTQSTLNILVPVDFSEMSIRVIEVAKRFAERFGATVHLAHVHQFYYPAGFTAPMPPVIPYSVISYERGFEKKIARRLSALADQRSLSSIACHVLNGAPAYDEICNLAKEIPADLIVMPTHGRTGLKHLFLGSTAERIVQHSPCPVFVARQSKRQSKNGASIAINSIFVPIDFSGCSFEGLRYAIQFAREFAAKIIVLHVVDLGPAFISDNYGMYDLTKYQEMARGAAKEQMRKFVRLAKFGDLEFEAVVTTGSAVWEICELAENRNVDLIITSTHGRTGFKHVLIGSTAEHVVRHAPCSVLVVPSHPKVRAKRLTRRTERGRKAGRRIAEKDPQEYLTEREKLTRKYRKLAAHAFPERRKTNKFRESHLA